MAMSKLRPWAPKLSQSLQPQLLDRMLSLVALFCVFVLKKQLLVLDGVPGRVLAFALEDLGPRLQNLFSTCLQESIFPHQWKTGKFVLLRKDGRPLDSPSAYRSIVLLNIIAGLHYTESDPGDRSYSNTNLTASYSRSVPRPDTACLAREPLFSPNYLSSPIPPYITCELLCTLSNRFTKFVIMS
ncbi:unnamed protein product [Leptosia nina]|uniref:Uncharacterized protein n=1 Tax=Leptosia nina TaxID=320188 RepID=A0AAV1IX53_9NEOP